MYTVYPEIGNFASSKCEFGMTIPKTDRKHKKMPFRAVFGQEWHERIRMRIQRTTFCGAPARNAVRFSAETSMIRCRIGFGVHA